MKTTVNVSLRFTPAHAQLLKRAARLQDLALATYIRETVIRVAAQQTQLAEPATVKEA